MEDGGIRHLGHECRVDMLREEEEGLTRGDGLTAGGPTGAGVVLDPKLPHVEFSLECLNLIGCGRDRKPNALIQVAVIDPREQYLVSHTCTEIVEGRGKQETPLFLTGVTFPPEYSASPETLVKLNRLTM
ncbi:type II inositol 3,4-bisphosphate 4-phosphatase-like [Esox lucius]|uniref:type II inositol 3,4-bisphosphate 4-phosphatase-like n=1 Tax=Esox lucius TaxID=8010 RepID=UPI001476E74B|nr:type II inositol 3,4-bisphosphate 4-phosphatase-like [Esox lucius]